MLLLATGCTTTSVLVGVVSAGTDTSVAWSVVKHLHGQLTEGDPRPCVLLNSVQRALDPRCSPFVAGSIVAADIERTGYAECPLTLATRNPQLWPALPELLDKGARPAACGESPLAPLARAQACPDFGAATPATLRALAQLGEADPRAVRHDVMRTRSERIVVSCHGEPSATIPGSISSMRAAMRFITRAMRPRRSSDGMGPRAIIVRSPLVLNALTKLYSR